MHQNSTPAITLLLTLVTAFSAAGASSSRLVADQPPATVQLFQDTSNIPQPSGLMWPPKPAYSATVHELGAFSDVQGCQGACFAFVFRCRVPTEGGGCEDEVSPVSGWSKCQSFSFFHDSGRCVAVVAADEWLPFAEERVTSGHVHWPPQRCSSRGDCSHNGDCNQSSRLCECAAAWTGDRCQTLALLPAERNAGPLNLLVVYVMGGTGEDCTGYNTRAC